ncbi:MAG: hypothetical protein PUG71_02910 [bacterium]|nr:hypothetical protein [bacterium]
MSFFHPNYNRPSNGKRLTGFPRYIEVLERNIKKFLLVNLITLVGFLPFIIGVALSILSSSVLILIPSCLIGGIFAGPALSCMYDTVMRCLRDASKNWWADCKHAWKQNWRQSLLPGILFCLMLGFYIFMAMLFWWSVRFPGWGTIAIYICSLFLFTMFFSICWPQIALFEQPFRQCLKNSLLFMLRFFPKAAGIALLQLTYWIILVLFLPWSVMLLPLTGIWFILYTANFLIYDTFNNIFQIEVKIADSFPEQVPFYEDDEAWLKRKQEEANRDHNRIG